MNDLHLIFYWYSNTKMKSFRIWQKDNLYVGMENLLMLKMMFVVLFMWDLRRKSNYEMKPSNVFSFHASIFPVMSHPPPPQAAQITPCLVITSPLLPLGLLITSNRRPGKSYQAWVTGNLTRNVNWSPSDPSFGRILVCLTCQHPQFFLDYSWPNHGDFIVIWTEVNWIYHHHHIDRPPFILNLKLKVNVASQFRYQTRYRKYRRRKQNVDRYKFLALGPYKTSLVCDKNYITSKQCIR